MYVSFLERKRRSENTVLAPQPQPPSPSPPDITGPLLTFLAPAWPRKAWKFAVRLRSKINATKTEETNKKLENRWLRPPFLHPFVW